ncbi:MAG TPA: Rieske 2Fe-2S domain-containing protein, partial [Actinomycetes bacterium]|nr:Rieske 2Fe-2S domain-containing protein [Actinomycetes bacterium]
MLTAEQNAELTRVGPGTPMGELLRRYWYPVAFTRQLDEFPVKRVRLLGESWALYRTPDGSYGVVEEQCPHRRASLAYGVVEPEGIRCGYHGWLFGRDGTCLDQ